MDAISPDRLSGPFSATVVPPGSKSLSNRALVLAALSDGPSVIRNVLAADDTAVMLDGLSRLGFAPEIDPHERTVRIAGRGGEIPAKDADLFCGNSGTTIRFLAAMVSLGRGTYRLDGVARMRQRPIGMLAQLLKNVGVRSESLETAGFPPVAILADRLPGGILRYAGKAESSQFLSAVLMAAPYARNEMRVDLEPPQTSWPYVSMTMRLMDEFGVTPELFRDPETHEPRSIHVPRGVYRATEYTVEPDASGASYFLALAAVHTGASVTVPGIGRRSLQGDAHFADVLARMGAEVHVGADEITVRGPESLAGIDVDLSDMPDMAQTLAVAAMFAEGPTTIRGLHTLRHKETDRLAALQSEITGLGAEAEVEGDVLTVTPPEHAREFRPARVRTYDDHRMAMSFAIAATKIGGVVIQDPQCVNKTYPTFFADLARATAGR